jgi:N-methylhydantoinase A
VATAEQGSFRLAADVGGTFIDFALVDEETGELVIEKQPARAATLVQEFTAGLERLPVRADHISRIFHGTTVGINAVLQERGAVVGLITNEGFRDVLALARGRRPHVYDALYRPPDPLVPRHLRREVVGRIGPDGNELTTLDLEAVAAEADLLVRRGVEAIAICFLHSYANSDHERTAAALIHERHPQIAVTASFEVATEWREFERTSTTVLNAYIQPLLKGYLGELEDSLRSRGFAGSLALMQSNGGVMSAANATNRPIRTLESGPAGGVIAAQALARTLGYPDVICADVGGTSYDVALIEGGEILESTQTEVGGRPIIGPIIDMVSIGAGGGSIAWMDEVGSVQVGPRSAGAFPGPAAFGLGGVEPTVTDCHLVLGRLDPDNFLGARMKLSRELAQQALREHIAEPAGFGVEDAAQGILEIAETNMTYAIRALTVERGLDPREFVMLSYGGGGGLFAAAVAEELDIETVLIPRTPANFSAVGILISDYREDAAATHVQPLAPSTSVSIRAELRSVVEQARRELSEFGFEGESLSLLHRVDVRYQGQDDTLTVALEQAWLEEDALLLSGLRERFVSLHRQLFGYGDPAAPLEVVATRCRTIGHVPHPSWREWPVASPGPARTSRLVHFQARGGFVETPVFDREALAVDQVIEGPAIIEEWTTTIVVPPRWSVRTEQLGNLILTRSEPER